MIGGENKKRLTSSCADFWRSAARGIEQGLVGPPGNRRTGPPVTQATSFGVPHKQLLDSLRQLLSCHTSNSLIHTPSLPLTRATPCLICREGN